MKAKHNAGGPHLSGDRWLQLVIGIIATGLIANVRYSCTLFVKPIHNATEWSLSAIQVSFTTFIITETWLGALEGWCIRMSVHIRAFCDDSWERNFCIINVSESATEGTASHHTYGFRLPYVA
jgi:hypothetical protein